ncbi:MAG: ATP-binding protein [Gracilimonas sp.]|nr:ATP-binding protein [Gracilimonas sp.]
MTPNIKTSSNLIVKIGLLLSVVIFILDLQTPLGIADGMLYVGVMLLSMWTKDRRSIIMTAITAIGLIIAGYLLSPSAVVESYLAITNRLFSIVVVIICAFMIIQYKMVEHKFSDYKYALDESSIIAITDQKGVIKKVNNNFCEISKYSEEELIGQDHRIINSGYHAKEFIRELWVTIANGKIWRGEVKNKAKDGSFYWVDTTIVPFLNEQGKPYQYIAIRSDITLRKKIEEDLIQRNQELKKFIWISSHDLQEPLRKLQFYINRLSSEHLNLTNKEKDYFRKIQQNAIQMSELLNDLRSFMLSKSTIDKLKKIDLNLIIAEVLSDLKNIIEEKDAIIEVTELCDANIIPLKFRQSMHHLISNALKFSKPDIPPHIIIKGRTVKGTELNLKNISPGINYCNITITDNGIGFDPHHKERIFEIFQHLNSKEEYSGTGIGLAIVKNVIENHNGVITATSELNKGAKFDIYIPIN